MLHRKRKEPTETHVTVGPYRTQSRSAGAFMREIAALPGDETDREGRPATRADCVSGPRPCGYVACRYHLGVDETSYGSIRVNFPSLLADLPNTCALDLADAGGATLEEIARLMNLTRERVRQIEVKALHRYHLKMVALDTVKV